MTQIRQVVKKKKKKKKKKTYSLIFFSFLNVRAIPIELLKEMSTVAFVQPLIRFAKYKTLR